MPLRGLAIEQAHSSDAEVREQARQALAITGGNEGKMLIDENGDCIADDGRPVQVDDWADDSKEEPGDQGAQEGDDSRTCEDSKAHRGAGCADARVRGSAEDDADGEDGTAANLTLIEPWGGWRAAATEKARCLSSAGSEFHAPARPTCSVVSLSDTTLSC